MAAPHRARMGDDHRESGPVVEPWDLDPIEHIALEQRARPWNVAAAVEVELLRGPRRFQRRHGFAIDADE